MKQHNSIAEKFVTAVHRRMVIVGSLEQFGVGLLSASILATLLIAVAIWQSMPTFPILIFSGFLAILFGTVLVIVRWPNRQAAAIEADRQLRLDDLLSSAVLITNSKDDFAAAMLAMADSRCARHSPSEVIFRRFGVGSWGAIGLAMSVAATLAVIPFGAAKSQAVDANASVLSATSTDLSTEEVHSTDVARIGSKSNDPMSQDGSKIATQTDQQANPPATDANHSTGNDSLRNTGTGGGIATTDHKTWATEQRPGESTARPANANGSTGGGGVASNVSGQNHESQTGTERGNASAPAGSWTGADTTGGSSKVNDANVPPEHRDLVRDYFNGK